MRFIFEDEGEKLFHYGTPRHSGRYPWGSGDNPYQHNGPALISTVTDMRKSGKYSSDTEIARELGMKSSEFRTRLSVARNEQRAARSAEAFRLREKGMSTQAIADRMGIPEPTVRTLLDPHVKVRTSLTQDTADQLKKYVDKKKYVDVGAGSEIDLGVSKERLKNALTILQDEGYVVKKIQVQQAGTNFKTTVKVLAQPGTETPDIYKNKQKIKPINETIVKDGKTMLGIEPPVSVDPKRVQIRYAEDHGTDKDGVIELRRGVDDISLGGAEYAQVRIAVNDTHYLKGMAVYSDNLPKGVDIVFNTNKHKGTPMLGDKDNTVLKPLKTDKDNPFGASIKGEDEIKVAQRYYTDKNGEKKLSCINIVNEPGDWEKWSKNLASQFLSKQPPSLAKQQLNLAYTQRREEFEEIKNLTNPALKKKMLESFSDECDSAAVKLKAAALPRQSTSVILPVPDMKDNEVYAPRYRDGEQIALVRYPHQGKFEIPILTVNNNQKSARKMIPPDSPDAIGINMNVAQRLSGADFDGDTVICIPTKGINIKSEPQLKALEGFDPKEAYPGYPGMKKMNNATKQREMGIVSNLITDMTLIGAPADEMARAVKHAQVVIDAEKHGLNYKQSEIDNGIAELKKKYQVKPDGRSGGASTIISRAKGEARVPVRKIYNINRDVDPDTGEKIYRYTGESYIDKKTGATKIRTQKSTQMAEAKDAMELVSAGRYPMELIYADHANKLKALANEARKEYITTPSTPRSPSAAKEYKPEVDSLKAKLNIALQNAPRERQAQLLASHKIESMLKDNPDMDKGELKRARGQALGAARAKVGAKKQSIEITEREWQAIQAGAVSTNVQMQIFSNTDLDRLKELATPRQTKTVSNARAATIRAMLASGYTMSQVADQFGLSVSTVSKIANNKS